MPCAEVEVIEDCVQKRRRDVGRNRTARGRAGCLAGTRAVMREVRGRGAGGQPVPLLPRGSSVARSSPASSIGSGRSSPSDSPGEVAPRRVRIWSSFFSIESTRSSRRSIREFEVDGTSAASPRFAASSLPIATARAKRWSGVVSSRSAMTSRLVCAPAVDPDSHRATVLGSTGIFCANRVCERLSSSRRSRMANPSWMSWAVAMS